MRIHLIAIGGKVMHNLALELAAHGHDVTGSDDEIYNPAKSRLAEADLLPDTGWDANRVSLDIDVIILGMHAHLDNPELQKAQELGLEILSFPEYIGHHTHHDRRIVVCGSHGKSTITAMIMHVLRHQGLDFDYLLGGLIDGFDRMVRTTDASIMVIEGDEYLSSKLEPTPKMLHYEGDIVIITGIEWDHMNVFPTFDNYKEQFRKLLDITEDRGGKIIWYKDDVHLQSMVNERDHLMQISYQILPQDHQSRIKYNHHHYKMKIFGNHNMANINAARLACKEVGIKSNDFFKAISSFRGVGKRLELINEDPIIYLDYAHAPSKVRATVEAIRQYYKDQKVLAIYELHTFSSLNKDFLYNYKGTMDDADEAIVYFDAHALEMKRMPSLVPEKVASSFSHQKMEVINDPDYLAQAYRASLPKFDIILMMSSGTFGGLDIKGEIE